VFVNEFRRYGMMLYRLVIASVLVPFLVSLPQGQKPRPGSSPGATSPDPNIARPIDTVDTVFIEEMTWLDVREAMRAGKTTVIVATGGVEMNGPYLATGKHNYIVRANAEAIARRLGNALVAPIVAFVPEGAIDPPAGHMRYPGTISVTEETYRRLLTDIVSSLKAHGFANVVLIGDSGGNQAGMKEVAGQSSARWAGGGTRVHYIPEYYDYPGLTKWLETQGIREEDEGIHDDFGISVQVMVTDPVLARARQRIARNRFTINGVPLAPIEKSVEWGRRVIDYRARLTVEAIRKAIAGASPLRDSTLRF
jgi:creatinine amidohydrolase/Fe(II)-dependent formamide hydrolase-like protein